MNSQFLTHLSFLVRPWTKSDMKAWQTPADLSPARIWRSKSDLTCSLAPSPSRTQVLAWPRPTWSTTWAQSLSLAPRPSWRLCRLGPTSPWSASSAWVSTQPTWWPKGWQSSPSTMMTSSTFGSHQLEAHSQSKLILVSFISLTDIFLHWTIYMINLIRLISWHCSHHCFNIFYFRRVHWQRHKSDPSPQGGSDRVLWGEARQRSCEEALTVHWLPYYTFCKFF